MNSLSLSSLTTPRHLPRHHRRCHVITCSTPQLPKTPMSLKTLTNLLWGNSLPPQLLISTVRSTWSSTWHLMMSQLAPSDSNGNYSRPVSQFSKKIPKRSSKQYNRTSSLVLYVGFSCPWAHWALLVRSLKGLEDFVKVTIVEPSLDGSWEFLDSGNRVKTLRSVYELSKGGYKGRATVPMLWDEVEKEVVCNESYDIIEMFNSGFDEFATDGGLDLEPGELKGEIERWNKVVYPNVNNGVYRCGFAQSQQAYDSAVHDLFSTLDMLNNHLASSRYLCGDVLTLADICLFTTLIRFDLVYNVLFKCTKRKLIEYSNLHAYLRDIYQIPKVAATCNFEAIMDGYYRILFPLNPSSIRPVMPSRCEHDSLSESHSRGSLSLVEEVSPIPVAEI